MHEVSQLDFDNALQAINEARGKKRATLVNQLLADLTRQARGRHYSTTKEGDGVSLHFTSSGTVEFKLSDLSHEAAVGLLSALLEGKHRGTFHTC